MESFGHYTLNCGGRLLSLERPVVMGILNATPDSFYSGSRVQTDAQIDARVEQILAEGGGIVDVGAFSTRPGAELVGEDEELRRLDHALGIVRRIAPQAIVSVDTYRPRVARECIRNWRIDIINDVSEDGRTGIVGRPIHEDELMSDVAAEFHVPYILMSVRPDVETMLTTLSRKIASLHAKGVADVVVDPGFGFGKTVEENYRVMANLRLLGSLDAPILAALSRKRMIYNATGGTADTALAGTVALDMAALERGASLLRVHDVKEAADTVAVFMQLRQAENPPTTSQ